MDKPPPNNTNKLTRRELILSGLEVKLVAISKYEEIIWKIRAGYVTILYGALTLLMGKEGIANLDSLAANFIGSVSIFFLICGFSLSAFLVDFGYVRKRIRVIVIRDMLMEVAYDPNCRFKKKLNLLLHVAAERPLKNHFKPADEKYKTKLLWNLMWILLPIYATTPILAASIYLAHCIRANWQCL